MSADKYTLLGLLKQVTTDTVTAMHPTNFMFANVIDLVKDSAGNVVDFNAKITDKLIFDTDFLVFGEKLEKNDIKNGDKLILLQQAGGQLFYVMDRVSENVTE